MFTAGLHREFSNDWQKALKRGGRWVLLRNVYCWPAPRVSNSDYSEFARENQNL